MKNYRINEQNRSYYVNQMKEYIKEHGYFILMCIVIAILIALVCLFPPKESLFKSLGQSLGQIFGEVIEGFNEGRNK